MIWGTEVEELGYDQPPWRQGAFLLVAKATRSLSCLVCELAFSLPEKCGGFIKREERHQSL